MDESWKAVPLEEGLKGLGKKIYEGMAGKGFKTVGDLLDWKNSDDRNWWTDIPGVGEAACSKIDDAIAKFI